MLRGQNRLSYPLSWAIKALVRNNREQSAIFDNISMHVIEGFRQLKLSFLLQIFAANLQLQPMRISYQKIAQNSLFINQTHINPKSSNLTCPKHGCLSLANPTERIQAKRARKSN